MAADELFSFKITADNPVLAKLKPSWRTAEFSAEDGIGAMGALHEAGDALSAVARIDPAGMTILGSAVMVAPGLLLTATHVLDEFDNDGPPPLFITFLENGSRGWLPIDVATLSGPSAFRPGGEVVSDISLVSCTLNSDALADQPLMLAPMQAALPVIGERLWAFGFRDGGIDDGAARLTPLVTSGLVTAAFPSGRGEWLASACLEVAMDAAGGMSGGAVVNRDGFLVGIVSSAVTDGGPTFVTLIWDALRLRVKGSVPKLRSVPRISLLGARAAGLAKIKGNVDRDPFGDIRLGLSDEEGHLMVASLSGTQRSELRQDALDADELEVFLDCWGSQMEDAAGEAATLSLAQLSLGKLREFLQGSAIPPACLDAVQSFSVADFEGVEELNVTTSDTTEEGFLAFGFVIDMRTLIWTVEVSASAFSAHEEHFHRAFIVPVR